jgi:hypothetical protein
VFKAFFTVLSLGALSLCLGRNAWAQQPVGTITQLQGTAQVQRTGDTLSAALTMLIEFHDQVRTAANSTVTITLAGNELLPEVSQGSKAKVVYYFHLRVRWYLTKLRLHLWSGC